MLAKHRFRLLYLSILLRRGAELRIGRGLCTPAARNTLLAFERLAAEIARVKVSFNIDQHALWSLRNQRQLTEEERMDMEERTSASVISAQARHPKAEGLPGSEERLNRWMLYASDGPPNFWTISATPNSVPGPGSLQPRSEQHRAWFYSLNKDTNWFLRRRSTTDQDLILTSTMPTSTGSTTWKPEGGHRLSGVAPCIWWYWGLDIEIALSKIGLFTRQLVPSVA
ncbi:hypothetical protein A4X13_0g9271 [Tilletia indica]|uniref:Uncharacterized protein n=1 Tax=Tilletia indica TaxID=43049 RepID=A0A8T8SAG5_9BASI|nr:hypothetical protein A4X13_0g9271 [Tilletia indica]